MWLGSCGLLVTVIVTKQPLCLMRPPDKTVELWLAEQTCVLQRSALAASLLALIASSTLSVTLVVSHDPYTAGLFSCGQPTCYSSIDHSCTMISSRLASKSPCVISTQLSKRRPPSSSTLEESWSPTPYESLPEKPMITVQDSMCKKHSFLLPRPSLASIRTATVIRSPPHHQVTLPPLPPLPVHIAPLRHLEKGREVADGDRVHYLETSPSSRYTRKCAQSRPAYINDPVLMTRPQTTSNVATWRHEIRLESAASSTYSRSISGGDEALPKIAMQANATRSPLGAVMRVDQIGILPS